jgi:hypothetical protein
LIKWPTAMGADRARRIAGCGCRDKADGKFKGATYINHSRVLSAFYMIDDSFTCVNLPVSIEHRFLPHFIGAQPPKAALHVRLEDSLRLFPMLASVANPSRVPIDRAVERDVYLPKENPTKATSLKYVHQSSDEHPFQALQLRRIPIQLVHILERTTNYRVESIKSWAHSDSDHIKSPLPCRKPMQ